jgi:hypothetical protein
LDGMAARLPPCQGLGASGPFRSRLGRQLKTVSVNGRLIPPVDFINYHWAYSDAVWHKDLREVMTDAWPHVDVVFELPCRLRPFVDEMIFVIEEGIIAPVTLHLRTDAHFLNEATPYCPSGPRRLPLVSYLQRNATVSLEDDSTVDVNIVSSDATLEVSGEVSIDGQVDVTGEVSIEGQVEVTGDVTIDGDVTVNGEVAILDTVEVSIAEVRPSYIPVLVMDDDDGSTDSGSSGRGHQRRRIR